MSRRRHTARDISPPPMFSDGENLPSPTARRPPRHGPPATTLVPSSQPTPEGNARKHFLSFSSCCRSPAAHRESHVENEGSPSAPCARSRCMRSSHHTWPLVPPKLGSPRCG